MKLIVGLGNIGQEYERTRHNLGFMAAERILKDNASLQETFWKQNSPLKAYIARVNIENREILLAKPVTFMNNSGQAVKLLLDKNNFSTDEFILIHDDVDLPLGKIRVRYGGAGAGHKGVLSVIDRLGTDRFLRIRMGIGRPGKFQISNFKFPISNKGVEDFVLENFTPSEAGEVKTMLKEVSRIVEIIIKEGIEKYMSKYNK